MRPGRNWIFLPLLALLLTSCGERGEEARKIHWDPAPAYTAEEIALPVESGLLYGSCTDGSFMYILAAEEAGKLPVLCRAPLDGGTAGVMEGYRLPEEGEFANAYFWGPFLGGDGKLWVWEEYTILYYDFPEDFDRERGPVGQYLTGQDNFCQLRQLDPGTGRELMLIDLGETAEELKRTGPLQGLTVDRQGIIYIGTPKRITALNSAGEVLFALKAEVSTVVTDETLALLPDGTAIALVDVSDREREVRSIDPTAKDWGRVRDAVSAGMGVLYSGSGPYQFFCQRNNTLYGRLEGEALDTPLLKWDAAGLGDNSGAECFALLDKGRAAVLTRTVPEGGTAQNAQLRLYRLTPSDTPPSDGKIKLVYGTIGDDGWARRRVSQFNEDQDEYYIELRDYAEGMLDYQGTNFRQVRDAAARLTAEILAGRAPDILDDRNIPLSALARQGVLADLRPLLDGDPALGREAVMDHVLACAETDGKLFRIFSNFRIDTLAVSAEIAGDRTSWTLEEMLDAYGGTLPEIRSLHYAGAVNPLLVPETPDLLLHDLLRMNLARYVDWSTGSCSFNTEEFQNLLRLCGGTEEENAAPSVQWGGRPAVYTRCLGSMADLAVDDAIFGGPETLTDYEALLAENGIRSQPIHVDGEWTGVVDDWIREAEQARESGLLLGRIPVAADLVTGAPERTGYAAYIGFPTGGASGSCFRVSDCLGITEACEDKEGAWQFVRRLLLPGGSLAGNRNSTGLSTTYDAFPVNRSDFEQLLEPQYFTDDTGAFILDSGGSRIEKAVSLFVLGDPAAMLVFLRSPTREQVDRFYALYNSIDHILEEDEALTTIIREQAQPYFAGGKSLEETAELIQNRATLYVNENR